MGWAPAARDWAHLEDARGFVPITRWIFPRQLRPASRDVGGDVVAMMARWDGGIVG